VAFLFNARSGTVVKIPKSVALAPLYTDETRLWAKLWAIFVANSSGRPGRPSSAAAAVLNSHKNKRRVLFKTNRAAKKWCQDIVLKHRVPKEWRHPNFPIK
jgi:hypothetical protein